VLVLVLVAVAVVVETLITGVLAAALAVTQKFILRLLRHLMLIQ
jgi:hypothetical protein